MKLIQTCLIVLILSTSLFSQTNYEWEILPSHNFSPINILHVFNNGDLLGELEVPKSLIISKNDGLSWENYYDGEYELTVNRINSSLFFEEDVDGRIYFQNENYIYRIENNSSTVFYDDTEGILDFNFILDFKVLPNSNVIVANRENLILLDSEGVEITRESFVNNSAEFLIGDNGKNYVVSPSEIITFNSDLSVLSDPQDAPIANDFTFYSQGRIFIDGQYSDDEGRTWQNIESIFGIIPLPKARIVSAEEGVILAYSCGVACTGLFDNALGEYYISIDNGDTFAPLNIDDELSDFDFHNINSNGDKICITAYDCNKNVTMVSVDNGQNFSETPSSIGQSVSNNTVADRNSNLIVNACDDSYYTYNPTNEVYNLRETGKKFLSNNYFSLNDNSFMRVDEAGIVFKSIDQGVTWVEKLKTSKAYFIVKGDNIYGYGREPDDPMLSRLFLSQDNGENWQTLPLFDNLRFSPDLITDVTLKNRILVKDPRPFVPTFSVCTIQGENCIDIDFGYDNGTVLSLFAANKNSVLYVLMLQSNGIRFWKTADGGLTFEQTNLPTGVFIDYSLYHLWNDNFVFVSDKFVYLSKDDGLSWELIGHFPEVQSLNSVSLGLDNYLYISNHGAGVIKSKFQLDGINRVNVNVFSDSNLDCSFQSNEVAMDNIKIMLNDDFVNTTSTNGQTSFILRQGTNKIKLLYDGNLYNACQEEFTIELNGNEQIEDVNIPLQKLENCIALTYNIGSPQLRRCESNFLTAQICNNGTIESEEANVSVKLDPLFDYIDASIPLFSMENQTYQFRAESLSSGECMSFRINFDLSCESQEGQEHCTSISTEYENICDDIDNGELRYCMKSIGSDEPNDKSIFVNGVQDEDIVVKEDVIEYMIRFQNKRMDTATTVRVVDYLAADIFDLKSIEATAASHDYTWSVEEGRLEVLFENILLVGATTNELDSYGYIKFKIKLRDEISIGVKFRNVAEVYFDFHQPIVTNIVDATLTFPSSVNNISTESFAPFPNPADKKINIPEEYIGYNLSIFTVAGQKIRFEKEINSSQIDVSTFPKGCYFIKLSSGTQEVYGKFLKM